MTKSDRELGMDRAITRRDFLNGVSVAVSAPLILPNNVPGVVDASRQSAAPIAENYPPALTGMRGSHPGSFEVAHAASQGKTWESPEDLPETYDLVVVGGGLSGLAAAYYFRKQNRANVRVLILDNHDDFGGHARRNEFTVGSRLLIAAGGASFIAQPWTFTAEGRELLKDIGLQYDSPAYHREDDLYYKLGLRGATYFDKETFGVDRLVLHDGPSFPSDVPRYRSPTAEDLAKTPLSAPVRQDLLRLYNDKRDYLAGLSEEAKISKLKKTSYQDYLLNVVKVQPQVLDYFHPGGPAGLTTDTTSAWYFFNRLYPGFEGLGLPLAADSPAELDRTRPDKKEPSQFRFPEGNAGVARLLVRWLIPEALPAKSMVDAETMRVNYGRLDEAGSPVRLRLSSTVVRVRNVGHAPTTATEVHVTYVRGDRAYRVRAKGAVLACYHAMIPYLCPELPEAQKAGLRLMVRGVNMVTHVGLRDWKAFVKLGVLTVSCPGVNYPGYPGLGLMQPVSLGGYRTPYTPEDPIVVTMQDLSNAGIRLPGRPPREQFRAARKVLYETTFEAFERKIRTHLVRLLSDGGFDPARDITAITINRWPHGYAMGENMFDPDWTDGERPWIKARKRFGRIAIAGSEAGAVHLMQCAFDQAYRAVDELDRRQMGWWQRF